MKINILRNSDTILNGYVNLDQFPGDGKTQCDITNLDPIVDNSLCNEIIANNVLEYYDYKKLPLILNNWISKLRHGGTLTVITTDFRAICMGVTKDIIQAKDTLELLYGPQSQPFMYKRSAMSVDMLRELLEGAGLKIVKVSLDNFLISITACRP